MANAVGKLISDLTEYIEVKTEQIKLRVISRVAKMLSSVISLSLLAALGLFFIFFLSFALANVLNEAFNSSHIGYFIISGFYFLIIIIIFILMKSKKIQGWLESLILKAAEREDEQDT
ncbi:MAG: hypothetical protein AAF391_03160 [Bacteroidota bacterium]